eukprot:m.225266 g.225266  ORF g.225266 m.225266 type:complete len:192 (-) comp11239_c0_seq1:44-619(-)
MIFAVVLATALALAAAQPPPPKPQISNSFAARIHIEARNQDERPLQGDGHWAVDFAKNEASEFYDIQSGSFPVHVLNLQRYDLGKTFELSSRDQRDCRVHNVTGALPAPWGFLAQATYSGQDHYRNVTVDLWEANVAGINIRLGVHTPNTNTPAFMDRHGAGFESHVYFEAFNATANPDPRYFEIPQPCQH